MWRTFWLNLLSGNGVGLTFHSSADGTSSYDVILDAVDGAFKVSKRPTSPSDLHLHTSPIAI